ncbi:AAA family ATPase [Paracoccus lutimaris]|uniref:AAA ATPase-like protein n=1 Tax=Paracoccus lutimaris TaxID=1490030 RepID=A0A368Z431_9RHOB|nr:ATP-binding protein [Paracoccus lutimaris]RCW87205.1 AAA ATPase-like protein [Paracoccus lutimaris]
MMRGALPDEVLIRAAVLGVFDPRELLDVEGKDYARDLAELAALSVETAFGPDWLWSLSEDARRAGLTLLPPPGPARVAHLAATRPREGDELGRAALDLLAPGPRADLRRLLAGRTTSLPDDRLIALFKMLELIGSSGAVLPDWLADGDARRRLQHAIMQRRTAKAAQAVLPDRFRGRTRELAALRDFALTGTLPKPGTGAIRRLADAIPDGVPTLLIAGIGGTGKSALLEQLRRSLNSANEVVLAQFDLDRAALRMGDQVALAQELLRQIGYALPALDAGIAGLRAQIRNAMALSQGPIDIEAAASAIFGAMSGLRELLAGAGMHDRALVIVIDTFEEALVLGPQRVAQIAEWLRTLRDHGGFAALRVILSGRSTETLTEMPQDLATLGVIELDELGTRAGRAKLRDMFRRLGIAHEDLIPDLIAEFGSNPLVIEVLAIFCRDKPRDEITGLMRGDDVDSRAGLDAEMRQCFLYTRILERLADAELKPLANPGLVLRRIEPAQISGLLAGPCGLATPMPPAQAQALFDRLASQVWLVRRPDPGSAVLEHLPDLRRLMLPQILAAPAGREVARAAADWFTNGPGASQPGATFDAKYYAILAGDADLPEDAEQLHDFALHLGAAAGDLPAHVQARLREAQGHVLRSDEIAHLHGPARNRALRKRRETQRTHGLETSVVAEEASFAAPPIAPAQKMTAADSAALAQSLFATGQFEQLAEAALPLTQDLIDGILTSAGPQSISEPMHHPAYLAALALLATDDDRLSAFGADLAEWLVASGRSEVAAPMRQGRSVPVDIALMLLTVTGQLNTPHGRAFDESIHNLKSAPFVAQSLIEWRAALARMPLGMNWPAVSLQVMPVFAPALARLIGGDADEEISLAIESTQRDQMRMLLQTGNPAALRDLNIVENALSGAVLHLQPGLAIQGELRPIIPGRQPEFQDPLRVLLTGGIAAGNIAKALAPLAAIPWWPVELRPEAFSGRTGATQILALIDMLDKFGALTAFVAALADDEAAPLPLFGALTAFVAALADDEAAPLPLRQLHRIMTRAESAWAGALTLQ